VPFLVSWPAVVKPGVSDALVSQIDLFASMAALLGSEESVTDIKDSQNYLNTLLGNEKEGRPYIVEAAYSLSVSDGEWKYIAPSNAPTFNKLTNTELGNSTEAQLYHLATDIGEQQNVAEQYPDKVEYLKNILDSEKSKTIQ
jgi:arylsulfatase A-like enzyme